MRMSRRNFLRGTGAAVAALLSDPLLGDDFEELRDQVYPEIAMSDGAFLQDALGCCINFCRSPTSTLLLQLRDAYPLLSNGEEDAISALQDASTQLRTDPHRAVARLRDRRGRLSFDINELSKHEHRLEALPAVYASQTHLTLEGSARGNAFKSIEAGLQSDKLGVKNMVVQALVNASPKNRADLQTFSQVGCSFFGTANGQQLLVETARYAAAEDWRVFLRQHVLMLLLNLKATLLLPGLENSINLRGAIDASLSEVSGNFPLEFRALSRAHAANEFAPSRVPQYTELICSYEPAKRKGFSKQLLDICLLFQVEYLRQAQKNKALTDDRSIILGKIACGMVEFRSIDRIEEIQQQLTENLEDDYIIDMPSETLDYIASGEAKDCIDRYSNGYFSPGGDVRCLRARMPFDIVQVIDGRLVDFERIGFFDNWHHRSFWENIRTVLKDAATGYLGVALLDSCLQKRGVDPIGFKDEAAGRLADWL